MGMQLFIAFLYKSFNFYKVGSNVPCFLSDFVIWGFSLFFLVNLANSLSILLIVSKIRFLVSLFVSVFHSLFYLLYRLERDLLNWGGRCSGAGGVMLQMLQTLTVLSTFEWFLLDKCFFSCSIPLGSFLETLVRVFIIISIRFTGKLLYRAPHIVLPEAEVPQSIHDLILKWYAVLPYCHTHTHRSESLSPAHT